MNYMSFPLYLLGEYLPVLVTAACYHNFRSYTLEIFLEQWNLNRQMQRFIVFITLT